MDSADVGGRRNQKRRTRKDLLAAAARLMRAGRTVTLELVAEQALVSRATVYRYFPSVDALLVEAALELEMPTPESVFGAVASEDPVERVERADAALHEMIVAHEVPLRTMLAHAIQRGASPERDADVPARQNRRTPLIEAALAPARASFDPAARRRLTNALAVVLGPEAIIVLKDVLQLDDAEARRIKRWMIRSLVQSAQRPAAG